MSQPYHIRPLVDQSVAHINPRKGWPRVFVYGTLKRGLSNHRVFEDNPDDCHFLGLDILRGPLEMVSLGGFPGLVDMSEQDDIACIPRNTVGEVWAVSDALLKGPMDTLEGNGKFYTRKKIPTSFKRAWCYFLPTYYVMEVDKEKVDPMIWMPTPDEMDLYAKNRDTGESSE